MDTNFFRSENGWLQAEIRLGYEMLEGFLICDVQAIPEYCEELIQYVEEIQRKDKQ